MGRKAMWAAAMGMVLAAVALAEEPARPVEKKLNLPPAWQAVPPGVRLGAELVAKTDGDRLLVERILGLRIDATTHVFDLALVSADFRTAFDQEIKGIRTRGEITFKDDLSVEAVREVTIREVIETIQRTIRKTQDVLGVKEERITNIARETKDTVLAVMGNGAVPGSKGQRKILAKRAAEVDAYRQLAEQVTGIRIKGDTYVRNLVTVSDQIQSVLAAMLRGAKTTGIEYYEDDTCAVTMSLTIREVLETIERTYRRHVRPLVITEEEWKNVRRENQDKVITATGKGAPRPAGAGEMGPAPAVGGQLFFEQKTIIKRVISREIGAQ